MIAYNASCVHTADEGDRGLGTRGVFASGKGCSKFKLMSVEAEVLSRAIARNTSSIIFVQPLFFLFFGLRSIRLEWGTSPKLFRRHARCQRTAYLAGGNDRYGVHARAQGLYLVKTRHMLTLRFFIYQNKSSATCRTSCVLGSRCLRI